MLWMFPVKVKLKYENIRPSFCTRNYDMPFHLQEMCANSIKKNSLEAGQIVPCGTEPSEWASKAFPVPKGDGTSVRIVTDIKKLNRQIKRPNWPTESSWQLLQHIDPRAKYYVSTDLTSGYHQIPINEESLNLFVISTPMGRLNLLFSPRE